MLEEEVLLVLGRLAVLGPDDAGRPVQVEHVDQLLLLLLQLLDLSLQVGVDAFQFLRLLRGEEARGRSQAAVRGGKGFALITIATIRAPLNSDKP